MTVDIGERLNAAFDKLIAARQEWLVAWEAQVNAQAQYDEVKTDMITGGHVVGKNAEERAAHLEKLIAPQSEALRLATVAERRARLRVETAEDALRVVLAVAALHAKI